MMKDRILVIDVEAVGLHGPGFAVGFTLIDFEGQATNEGIYAIRPELISNVASSELAWVHENVNIDDRYYNCLTLREVHSKFWAFWMQAKDRSILAADVVWPVESNFLSACVADQKNERHWQGPYPLLDIASFRMAHGIDAMATEERLPNELPAHNPLNDARQSARQLVPFLKYL